MMRQLMTFTPTETGTHKVEILYTAKGDSRKASKTFTVQGVPTGANAAAEPAFESATLDRSVDEGKANANVGDPIRATDATPGDSGKLTYTVDPDTHFSITNTGQLKTKMALDSENPPSDLLPSKSKPPTRQVPPARTTPSPSPSPSTT